jgi:8-oxo-dGTP diphosphatase
MKNTTLCYLIRGNDYLMLHRTKKEKDENQGKWVGVGGKLEEGESPEECANREIWEETGLTAQKLSYKGIVTFVSDLWGTEYMHLFTSDSFTGELKECEEGELKWVNRETVSQLPIWEGDKIFLELLEANVPFFSLKLVYEGEKLQSVFLNGKPLCPPCKLS